MRIQEMLNRLTSLVLITSLSACMLQKTKKIESISICAQVRNCEKYGSDRGVLRFLAMAKGDIHTNKQTFEDEVKYSNISKAYDISSKIVSLPGGSACATFDLRTYKAEDGYNDEFYYWDDFSLQGLGYQPQTPEEAAIYVDNDNNRVKIKDSKTLEILKEKAPSLTIDKASYAHPLSIRPTITNVDFQSGKGEVVFDCQNPNGGGNVSTQLSKFLLKETIKNQFKSFSNSATASKEVNETRKIKELEIKTNKKENSIAL